MVFEGLRQPRFAPDFFLIAVADDGKRLFVFQAHLAPVDFTDAAGQRAGAGEENLVRVHHILQRKRFFHHRNAVRFADIQDMRARDARQNQLVAGCCIERTVFENMHVGMRAFRHAVAAMEDGFVTARLHRLFIRHNSRQKVDCLDIAVEEAFILHSDALIDAEGVAHLARTNKCPNARLIARARIRMIAHASGIGRSG